MRLKQLDPKLTQQRMARLDAIDAAVGRLQVKIEEVSARLDAMEPEDRAAFLVVFRKCYDNGFEDGEKERLDKGIMTDDTTPSKHLLGDFLIDHVKHFGAFPTEYEDETGVVHFQNGDVCTGVVHSGDSYWHILTGAKQ